MKKISLHKIVKKIRNFFDSSLFDVQVMYGLNVVLRRMLKLPNVFFLPVWQQHGWYQRDYVFPPDLINAKKNGIMLVFSEANRKAWMAQSDIPCYVGGLMLARYRRFMKWDQKPDAKGTVFYAAHGTVSATVEYSVQKIHEELCRLPAEYHPITVSLHPHDYYVLDFKKQYEKFGYRVVTSGTSTVDPDFSKNFYETLCSAKYTCSNDVGTYILYSIEMNIPFFFIGKKVSWIMDKSNDDGLPEGVLPTWEYPEFQEIYHLFDTGPAREITAEQRHWFERETGVGKEISFDDLRKIIMRPHFLIFTTIKIFSHHLLIGLKRLNKWE